MAGVGRVVALTRATSRVLMRRCRSLLPLAEPGQPACGMPEGPGGRRLRSRFPELGSWSCAGYGLACAEQRRPWSADPFVSKVEELVDHSVAGVGTYGKPDGPAVSGRLGAV